MILRRGYGNRSARLSVEGLEDRSVPAAAQLPDLTVWADQSRGYMYDWYLDTTTTAGRTLLRLSNAVANIGAGPLEIRGGAVNADNTQLVVQRVYDDAGGFADRPAGAFVYHQSHGHIHFEDFARYNLRAVTAGDGVGAVMAAGSKTSFRLEDTTVYNSALPGYSATRGYYAGDQVQGISVGWADVYRRNLADQWIDVTGVAAGTYWLESVVDPENTILESNESNNVVRIKITLGAANAPDYAGNTLATARDIGALADNQSFHDYVGRTDSNDYYRFTLGAAATVSLRVDGLQADADVQLLSAAGSVLARSNRYGIEAESISRSLAAGTYLVRVYPYWNANTPYTLNISGGTAAADGAGNTLGTARDIGDITGTQSFRDLVGAGDTDDYYRFRATGTSDTLLSLRLDGLSGNADVQLLDESGVVLATSTNGGTTAETISHELHSGHAYFVRVFAPGTATANYALTLTGAASTTPDGAGNTLATARDLGTLSANQTLPDQVGANDPNDYYRFTLATAATLNLRMDGLSADADVELLSSTGAQIARSVNSGTVAESLSRSLAAGTYYVRVYPYGGAGTTYSLHLSATAAAPTDGAGNSYSTALNIGALGSSWSFQDSIGTTDTNDYIRFTVDRQGTFNLRLDGLTADADVQLINSSGVVASSRNTGTSAESITRTLSAGTYYIRIFPYGSVTTDYRLSLSFA
jgi:hypothetical protein